jgi:hypothetical protein
MNARAGRRGPHYQQAEQEDVDHRRRKNSTRRRTLSDELGGPLTALLLLALTACGPDCELGFDAGEQFRITVRGVDPDRPEGCAYPTLEPGTSFVLTAAERTVDNQGMCYSRGAVPVAPRPFAPVLTECTERGVGQLSAECSGQLTPDCASGATFFTRPTIRRSDRVIEDGTFAISWRANACCPYGSFDEYTVRIERIGKLL